MKKITTGVFCLCITGTMCAQTVNNPDQSGSKIYSNAGQSLQLKKPQTPDEIWGNLFVDVQLKRTLGDNKSFVDAIPRYAPKLILDKYNQLKKEHHGEPDLKNFVTHYFKIPVSTGIQVANAATLKEHLENLWPALTRKADVPQPYSSLLPLPKAYVVPGGRFREIYYWDSYFTMLGLATSNRYDLIENMLDNFSFLIHRYGHIPNGNRSYYLSRSQPPYFALMVNLLQQKKGDAVYQKYLPAMLKEYNWWMEGEGRVNYETPHRRVVRLPDGEVMNRYWDDKNAPREESYYEDEQNGLAYQGKDERVYTHLRAGAESGWDFSSRWLADTLNLATIETTNIIPVDLNCLLYKYEYILSRATKSQKQTGQSAAYHQRSEKRKAAILKYCWKESSHYFFDYNLKKWRLPMYGRWRVYCRYLQQL